MTDKQLFLDSSAWLGYFLGNTPQTGEIVEGKNILFTSILSIHEVFRKIARMGRTESQARRIIAFVEENSIILGLDREIAIRAAWFCTQYGLHTVDSLIYATAMSTPAVFVTLDRDFEKTPKTMLLPVL